MIVRNYSFMAMFQQLAISSQLIFKTSKKTIFPLPPNKFYLICSLIFFQQSSIFVNQLTMLLLKPALSIWKLSFDGFCPARLCQVWINHPVDPEILGPNARSQVQIYYYNFATLNYWFCLCPKSKIQLWSRLVL